jgi:FtsH-binding integral membrane protein
MLAKEATMTMPNAAPLPDAAASPVVDVAAFTRKVYRWMAIGLGLTGLFASAVVASPSAQRAIFGNPLLFFGLLIAELGMVWVFSRSLRKVSYATAATMFLAYCATSGLTFSIYFLVYTRESIAVAFYVTGGTFAAMSAFGTLTKKDLSSWGSLLMMGLFGVIIASLVNLFVGSSALGYLIAWAGVLIFTGLVAYDTQKIRAWAAIGDDRLALQGALALYLDFVNLFIMLLRLFGRRRR